MNAAILSITEKDIERFWSWVDVCGPDECWPWKGHLVKGYGGFSLGRKGKHIAAHQVAAFLHLGAPSPLDLYALHVCDFRPCCNGSHLFWGTNQDNQIDASRKGVFDNKVGSKGIANGRAKLTEEQVLAIRRSTLSTRELAVQYTVSKSLIGQIRHGDIWRHCGI